MKERLIQWMARGILHLLFTPQELHTIKCVVEAVRVDPRLVHWQPSFKGGRETRREAANVMIWNATRMEEARMGLGIELAHWLTKCRKLQ